MCSETHEQTNYSNCKLWLRSRRQQIAPSYRTAWHKISKNLPAWLYDSSLKAKIRRDKSIFHGFIVPVSMCACVWVHPYVQTTLNINKVGLEISADCVVKLSVLRCSLLQRFAVFCSVLPCVVSCSELQCNVVCGSMLQNITSQCVAVCSVLR